MKKIISCLFAAFLTVGALTGCSADTADAADTPGTTQTAEAVTEQNTQNVTAADKLNIVCTIFPLYDWTRQIVEEAADVTLLMNNGTDLHSYQPSTSDIMTISSCDVLIYVGGESDKWIDDILKNATNEGMLVINLLEVLGDSVKTEEIKEGMEHDHDHDDDDHNHDHDDAEYDEHVWLSLRNAKVCCASIAEQLSALDAANSDTYTAGAKAYNEELNALDKEFETAISQASGNTLLYGDRFPFRYLVNDYGLDYYAAFPGCSAETEASFETIVFLANKVDELKLKNIMVIDGSDASIAQTIADSTESKDQSILVLNSMQSVTAADIESGTTYLSCMEDNLQTIKEALGN